MLAPHEENLYRRVLQRVTDILPAIPRQDNIDDNDTSMPAEQESGLEEVPEKIPTLLLAACTPDAQC